MIKCGFLLYRSWGSEIVKNLNDFKKERPVFEIDTVITIKNPEFDLEELKMICKNVIEIEPTDNELIYKIATERKFNIFFCYSWSWILKEPLISEFICLALHPSPLPLYRGGTPIQHQIIAGETESKVSVFRIEKGVDSGPIYRQETISFLGNIKDIFTRMVDLGSIISRDLIADLDNGILKFTPQVDLDKHPPNHRRTPAMSEIKLSDLPDKSFQDINNLVRGLTAPYPNAFIAIGNKKIMIQSVQKYLEKPKNSLEILTTSDKSIETQNNLCIKVVDGYAVLSQYYWA